MFGAIFARETGFGVMVGRPLYPVSAPKPHALPSTVVRDDEPLLVDSARSGNTSAFEELVARYEDKIFRLTSNITGNREDAEDAMQDAFLKAYAHLKDFHGESRFYTWLVRIAANEALMHWRRHSPKKVRWSESEIQKDYTVPSGLPPTNVQVDVGITEDGSFVWRPHRE